MDKKLFIASGDVFLGFLFLGSHGLLEERQGISLR